jgi:hypothetical protein
MPTLQPDGLEPCGRCGGKAERKHNLSPSDWIECTQCGFEINVSAETWNEVARILHKDKERQTWLEAVAGTAITPGADPEAFMELVGRGARHLSMELPETEMIRPADVLAYIDEWKGQENDPEEVRDFVQDMAQMIAEGKTLRDVGMSGYAHFVEWLDERPHKQREGEKHA